MFPDRLLEPRWQAILRVAWTTSRQVKSGSFSRAIASHRQGPPRCCSLRDEGKDEGVAVGIDKGNAEGLSGGFDYRLGCDQVEKLR